MSKNYAEIMRSFERFGIDPTDFGHMDHIGVAYEMLRTSDFIVAAGRYFQCINTIATRAGASQKFNTTITLAFLSLIAERARMTPHKTFDDFIKQNQDLLSSDLLSKSYPTSLITRIQSTSTRSVRAKLRRVAVSALWVGPARPNHKANAKLTFKLDHWMGADHPHLAHQSPSPYSRSTRK